MNGGDIYSIAEQYIEQPTAVVSSHAVSDHHMLNDWQSVGPHELHWPPQNKMQKDVNLSSFEVLSKGGHFLAMEQPHLLADAIRRHFGQPEIIKLLKA